MPTWLVSLLVSLSVGVILFLLNKITFKSSADLTNKVTNLTTEFDNLKNKIQELETEGWTTAKEVDLERRLVRLDERVTRVIEEVNFTKTSHQEFLRLLEKAMIPVAHSPHTPEIDALLEARERGEQLSPEQLETLIKGLEEEADNYSNLPGKKVGLRSLAAIYRLELRAARRGKGLLLHGPTA